MADEERTEEYGIEETEDVAVFFASVCEAIYESVKDGKITLGDYKNFIPTMGDLIPAVSGIDQVPKELGDISDEEVGKLVDKFKMRFDLPDDIVEEFVENCISGARLAFRNVQLFKMWKERETV